MSALVTYPPAASGTNYFAVVAVSSDRVESDLSRELPVGTPNPCRHDRCTSEASCDFSTVPDDTACDDAFFCNGAETCEAGSCSTRVPRTCADGVACTVDACDEIADRCTHVVAPGCCLACDVNDPCLADACARGDCAAGPGTEIEVDRIQFRALRSAIKLTAKGKFSTDPSLDPSATGAFLELHAADGAVLYSASIAADVFTRAKSGRNFRFSARDAELDPRWNGLVLLDFRARRNSTWLVTAKVETPELIDAFLEATVTWVIRLGTTCVRHLDVSCEQKPTLSICR